MASWDSGTASNVTISGDSDEIADFSGSCTSWCHLAYSTTTATSWTFTCSGACLTTGATVVGFSNKTCSGQDRGQYAIVLARDGSSSAGKTQGNCYSLVEEDVSWDTSPSVTLTFTVVGTDVVVKDVNGNTVYTFTTTYGTSPYYAFVNFNNSATGGRVVLSGGTSSTGGTLLPPPPAMVRL